jgi:hypothetical protein
MLVTPEVGLVVLVGCRQLLDIYPTMMKSNAKCGQLHDPSHVVQHVNYSLKPALPGKVTSAMHTETYCDMQDDGTKTSPL